MGSDLLTFQPSTESAELAAERARVADLEIKLEQAQRVGTTIEVACIELAAALGVEKHGGWRDLLAKVDTAARRSTTWRTEIGKAFNKRVADLPAGLLHEDTGWQVVADWITSGGAFRMDIAAALGIDPWVHDGDNGDGRRTWESIVEIVRELRRAAEKSVVELKNRLADVTAQRNQIAIEINRADAAEGQLKAVRQTFAEMSRILGCGREVPQVFDAITRLKEQNCMLATDNSSALGSERRAHANTKAELEQFEGLIRAAIKRGSAGRFAQAGQSVSKIVEDLAEEWMRKTDRIAVLEAKADEDTDDDLLCDLCDETEPARGGVFNCEDCERCDECHEQHGCAAIGDSEEIDSAPPNRLAVSVGSLQTVIATSGRDWANSPDYAWIYGVVVGWDATSLTELSAKFGWKQETLDQLTSLHREMVEASGGES